MHQPAFSSLPVVVPRYKVYRDSQITVNDMLVTIGRAYLASGQEDAVLHIRQLSIPRLLQEFHWAVAYLSAKGLLTEQEELRAGQYATEYLEGPFS